MITFRGRKLCALKSRHECANMFYHHAMQSGHAVYFMGVFMFAHGLYSYVAGVLALGVLGGYVFRFTEDDT
jgi:hypothetical protein